MGIKNILRDVADKMLGAGAEKNPAFDLRVTGALAFATMLMCELGRGMTPDDAEGYGVLGDLSGAMAAMVSVSRLAGAFTERPGGKFPAAAQGVGFGLISASKYMAPSGTRFACAALGAASVAYGFAVPKSARMGIEAAAARLMDKVKERTEYNADTIYYFLCPNKKPLGR